MLRRVAVLWLLLMALGISASGQETSFGKNKVQYKNFDWNYIQTRHFDIHFYEEAYTTAKFAAEVLESAYVEVTTELNYTIQRRIPIFIYNSHSDFQQTNIISSLIPEGVGGFTEAFKNRIVIPFYGSYEDFRHVLHHELTHAVVYDLLYGNFFGSLLSQRRLFNVPLWFAEGYAEYSSRHGWDYFSDMFVRDATINGYLAPPDYIGGFLAYKQGQAMIKYIADKYGEAKLGELLQKGKVNITMGKTIKSALGISEEDFWKDFEKEMKRRYWPEIAARKEADEIGKQLTKAREDGSYFNESPVYSPEGDKIAMFSDRHDYTEILLISAVDGTELRRLVRAERSADMESLHSFVSGMSFSPDGRTLVFVAKSQGHDAMFFVDIKSGDVKKRQRFDYYTILTPEFSPDGAKIAFSALEENRRDLFIYDIESGQTQKLTDDRFDDLNPSWLPNSQGLVFSSDRSHPQTPVLDPHGQPYVATKGAFKPGDFAYGDYNLFQIDLTTKAVKPLDVGPGQNTVPRVSPDGQKVAFISNRNGIDNLYIGYLATGENYAITDILSGIRTFSWAPDGTKIAFSAFYQGAFDVFTLQDIVKAGDNGILRPTDFVTGKYNHPFVADSTTNAADTLMAIVTPPDTTIAAADTAEADSVVADSLTLAAVTDSTATATVDSTLVTDSLQIAQVDSLQPDSTVTTGVVGDEYVYVSPNQGTMDPLDSLLTDVANDTGGTYGVTKRAEPAAFDSIPERLAGGEYQVQKYKVRFTPDYVGGGFSYDTFFGVRGQSYFVFSDYLGNHQLFFATDLVNTIDQSNIQAYYFNNTRRTRWGGGLFHSKNYYLDNVDHLFSDRFYGFQGVTSYPLSIFSRVEFGVAQFFIDRKYYDFDDDRPDRSSKVTVGNLSYVTDNVLWGYTGPLNGRRARVNLGAGVNLFDSKDIEYYSTEADYRKYIHFGRNFSFAFRAAGGASFGTTPKMYFIGGTTNWIGNRTLDAKVYDVENLYFSDVVTPLRGVEYYGISGTRFGLVNFEFRFPMIQVFAMRFPLRIVISDVSGAIFSDLGSAWTDDNFKFGTSKDGSTRLVDAKSGFGFGLRANLFGFALLRWDVAWSTDFEHVSDRAKHYFSLGADF